MSLIRKHVAVLQAWACLALVFLVCLAVSFLLQEEKIIKHYCRHDIKNALLLKELLTCGIACHRICC